MIHPARQSQKYLTAFLLMGMGLWLSACEPKIAQEGFPPAAEMQAKLAESKTRQDVLQALGTPSIRNNYGDEIWYYVSTEKQSQAFFAPEITRQDVLKITFAADGTIAKTDVLNKDAGKNVAMFDKITPTEGHALGFAEQVLGNVGRFNAPTGTGKAGTRSTHSSGAIPGRF